MEVKLLKKPKLILFVTWLTLSTTSAVSANRDDGVLEEVIVSAQKREQSLQEAPIAITVLDSEQLEVQGISELAALSSGTIPSLRIQPLGTTTSNLVIGIRGNAPVDAAEVTREPSVAIYLDGVYLGRSHSLGMELPDLRRIEVLRGPQGTLFGRNAIGGAINLISSAPSGEFDFKQSVSLGRFDEVRSVTRINFPEFAGIRAKIDYLHFERDGWVNNTAAGESDFAAHNKDGGRLSLHWQHKTLSADYHYDRSYVNSTQPYIQFYRDNIGVFGQELDRRSQTRAPVTPLDPTVSKQSGHALTLAWAVSDTLLVKSITSYRKLKDDLNNNFAGTLYFNGLIFSQDTKQDQVSQEFQLIGDHERLKWAAGLFYFDEDVEKIHQNLFSLDIFGVFGPVLASITPPTTFDALGLGAISPRRDIDANAESLAAYGHATWTPAILDDRLQVIVGLRYTRDERSGNRDEVIFTGFELDSDHIDYQIGLDYQWTEGLSSYIKWSTAYKAGGVHTGSNSLAPFDEETARTLEIGIKSEFLDKRVRLNAAIFFTDYEDMQLDFNDPLIPTIVETINAANKVQVDGLELELTAIPIDRLYVGVSYTYLHGDMPRQPNPLAGGALRSFRLAQTPQHAGALSLDYSFPPGQFGTLSAHLDVTSTSEYAYVAHGGLRQDSYTLVNGRLTLADIKLGADRGAFKAALWARNLTDAEYVVYAFPVGGVAVAQAFGTPRTFGLDLTYKF